MNTKGIIRMGLIAKIKKAFNSEKDEEEDEVVSNDVSSNVSKETEKETEKKQDWKQNKKQSEVPEDQYKRIAEVSKFATSVDNKLQEIDRGIREIKKDMAKEDTLKEVHKDVVDKSTMKDLLENYMLKQGMKYFNQDVSGDVSRNVSKETKKETSQETDQETSSETKEFIQNKSQEKAEEFTEEIEQFEKYKKAKEIVIDALKGQGKIKFGNDEGNYGLTKLTGLNRSWIYKVCYLGWDSSGSVEEPAENTLLDENKIKIDKSGRAFKVVWNG